MSPTPQTREVHTLLTHMSGPNANTNTISNAIRPHAHTRSERVRAPWRRHRRAPLRRHSGVLGQRLQGPGS